MDQLEQLKAKYNSVLEFIKQSGVHLTHLHVQDNKLFIQGTAPSEQIKNEAWNRVKAVDSTYRDLTCDLTVDSSLPQPQAAQAAAASANASMSGRTYTYSRVTRCQRLQKSFTAMRTITTKSLRLTATSSKVLTKFKPDRNS
jgi:pentose-5-phosphate-3-epimerase